MNSSRHKAFITFNMFYKTATDYLYSNPIEKPDGNIYLPLEVDTEYTHPAYDINNPDTENICTNLTVQIKPINSKEGVIYAHPENRLNSRHKVFKHGWVVADYLEDAGHLVELIRTNDWTGKTPDLPIIQVDIFTFFAVAEIMRMFQGEYLNDINLLCTNPDKTGIEQGRRLRTYTRTERGLSNYALTPWIMVIDGTKYKVRLTIYDTCAVQGIASYASFCSNSNVTLMHKDNFTNDEKSRMDEMYLNRPEDFDSYALGDLHNHDALMGNAENFKKIYQALDLEKYYSIPRMTIGSTVSKIIESAIYKTFKSDTQNKDLINKYCRFACADYLKRKTTSTGCLNAKVDGGRCRNNRPTDTLAKGLICDIDISGCYGEGLRVQTYPLGVPVLIDYPIDSEINKYQTLREFLKSYGKELVPGLWQARVSCKQGYTLKYKQDYLASWFPPKDISKMPTDTDFNETEQWWTIDNVGEVKVLTNEINHAVITHDFIQWLTYVASEKQRKELLDNLIVETFLYYPASERVDSIDELLKRHANHQGSNTSKAVKSKQGKNTRKISVEEECHVWFGINIGELLVDQLLLERKQHPKKTPFNELYKLCINTVYGDMVSPFFTVGNVVVGNNITARARALAWCMEKGLHGWQSITDGCAFEVDKVLYGTRQRVTGENTVNLYADTKYNNHTFAPLPYQDDMSVTLIKPLSVTLSTDDDHRVTIDLKENVQVTLDYAAALDWINKAAMWHLQGLFPNLDILHQKTKDVKGRERVGQFEFEAKGLYDTATFHGTANYSLSLNGEVTCKMRSYSKKNRKVVELNDDGLLDVYEFDTPPSDRFLISLQQPKNVERSQVFIKPRILKVGDYRRNYKRWRETSAYPGMTIETSGLIREFSLSQFTFQTYEQLKSWRKEYEKFLNTYGQSYEMFYLNEDGTLNYQKMVVEIDAKIRSGKLNFFDGLDKRAANVYRQYLRHEMFNCLVATKNNLDKRYQYTSSMDELDDLDLLGEDDSEIL